eukprot:jgi/Bigna1/77760/fgenesh1_pg.50_\
MAQQQGGDKWARALANASADKPPPPAFGIVLTTLWQTTSKEMKDQYEQFRKDVLDAVKDDDCLYIYPYHALHCTVASLCKFTCDVGQGLALTKDLKVRDAYVEAWQKVVDQVYKDIEKKPIQVTFKRPELPGTTAIMMIDNPEMWEELPPSIINKNTSVLCNKVVILGKEVFRIRELLKAACANNEILRNYEVKCDVPEVERPTTNNPNFSLPIAVFDETMFTRPPKDMEAFRKTFTDVASKWEPRQETITEFYLTTETVPYMHMDKKSNVKKTYSLD